MKKLLNCWRKIKKPPQVDTRRGQPKLTLMKNWKLLTDNKYKIL